MYEIFHPVCVEHARVRQSVDVAEPTIDAFGARVDPLHLLNLMTPLLHVMLIDAYSIQPYNLRSVPTAERFKKPKKIFAHLERLSVQQYGLCWLRWTPNV
jgi:hypothetical protein